MYIAISQVIIILLAVSVSEIFPVNILKQLIFIFCNINKIYYLTLSLT